jgi:hypothetical protein
MSAETCLALTLSELIQDVYPTSGPSVRSAHAGKEHEMGRPAAQQPNPTQGFEGLSRAFGLALFIGAFFACIGIWLALMYSRSLPPSPGYAEIDVLVTTFEAAIAGALMSGISVFLCAILRFGPFEAEARKGIALAFIALVAILLFVGGVAWMAFLVFSFG